MNRAFRNSLVVLAALGFASLALAQDEKEASDRERADALKKFGLTLSQCIEKGAAELGGPAVFGNVHVGKRGKFAVQVDSVVDGQRATTSVDEHGSTAKGVKDKHNRDRKNQPDYPKLAEQFGKHQVTLAELVAIAEKETGGVAVNAWGHLQKDELSVSVLIVPAEGKSVRVSVDPKTKKVSKP